MRRRRVERGAESIEQIPRPGDRSRVEQCQQKLGVVFLEPREITQLADLVTNHHAEVPQGMEKTAKKPFVIPGDGLPEQDQQVDVGMEAQMPASVAAERQDRHRPGRRRRFGVQLPQDRVDTIRISLEGPPPAGAPPDIGTDFGTSSFERRPHGPGLSRRVGAVRG